MSSAVRHPVTGKFVSKWTLIGPQLGLNRSRVPGGLGFDLDEPVTVCDILWMPADGAPNASPIGAALAAETASAS